MNTERRCLSNGQGARTYTMRGCQQSGSPPLLLASMPRGLQRYRSEWLLYFIELTSDSLLSHVVPHRVQNFRKKMAGGALAEVQVSICHIFYKSHISSIDCSQLPIPSRRGQRLSVSLASGATRRVSTNFLSSGPVFFMTAAHGKRCESTCIYSYMY